MRACGLKSSIVNRWRKLLRVRNLESLGVLAGGIAHDFNNFLTVVQGNIELAKMQLGPDSAVQEILDDSAAACQRAAFLSSQLLTFAKGGAPVRRVVSIAKLIMDAVQLARAGSPVSIGVEIAGDLWPAEADAGQISQVLHNLLLNAKQAMPEGGIVEVSADNIAAPDVKQPGSGAPSESRSATMVLAFPLNLFPEYLIRISRPSRAAADWDWPQRTPS